MFTLKSKVLALIEYGPYILRLVLAAQAQEDSALGEAHQFPVKTMVDWIETDPLWT
jgi:hypothetical protein